MPGKWQRAKWRNSGTYTPQNKKSPTNIHGQSNQSKIVCKKLFFSWLAQYLPIFCKPTSNIYCEVRHSPRFTQVRCWFLYQKLIVQKLCQTAHAKEETGTKPGPITASRYNAGLCYYSPAGTNSYKPSLNSLAFKVIPPFIYSLLYIYIYTYIYIYVYIYICIYIYVYIYILYIYTHNIHV